MTENEDILDDELDFSSFEQEDENQDSQSLTEHFRVHVDFGQASMRVDKFLFTKINNVSRNKIQEAADNGLIFVNDKPIKASYKIKPLDEIVIMLPGQKPNYKIVPENIPLDIIYEDEDIIVVNKKAGMVVHPAHGNYSGTLVNALAYHLGQNNEFKDDNIRPGLVHRIDKDTSGILVIAKNENAKTNLGDQFFKHTINRRYYALVWGDFKEDEGYVEGNIGRNPRDRKSMLCFPDGQYGKPAFTRYRVIERFGYVTLIECKLETGRTHQIRVHMKHINHPLFSDEVYGGNKLLRGTTFAKYKKFVENCFEVMPRQALHAKTLEFVHPVTKKIMSFDSQLPEDFLAVLEKWRAYSLAGRTEGYLTDKDFED